MKKQLLGIFASALVLVLCASVSGLAQTSYSVTNQVSNFNLIVEVCAWLTGGGGTPICQSVDVASGSTEYVTIPSGYTVNGVWLNGTYYPVGFSGPAAPPNPPGSIAVSLTGTTIQ